MSLWPDILSSCCAAVALREAMVNAIDLQITSHARVRMQQRGIPEAVVECLAVRGRRMYDHRGAAVRYFDRRLQRKLEELPELRSIANLNRHADAYAIITHDEVVVTVGHRYRRINRN